MSVATRIFRNDSCLAVVYTELNGQLTTDSIPRAICYAPYQTGRLGDMVIDMFKTCANSTIQIVKKPIRTIRCNRRGQYRLLVRRQRHQHREEAARLRPGRIGILSVACRSIRTLFRMRIRCATSSAGPRERRSRGSEDFKAGFGGSCCPCLWHVVGMKLIPWWTGCQTRRCCSCNGRELEDRRILEGDVNSGSGSRRGRDVCMAEPVMAYGGFDTFVSF